MNKIKIAIFISIINLLLACKNDIPMVNLGIDEEYAVERMKALVLHPEFSGDAYEWSMPDSKGQDSIVSVEHDFIFCSADTGTFRLKLRIIDTKNPVEQNIKIVTWKEQVAYSRYITTVYEYSPAPGQFVNEMPKYEYGDTEANMIKKAQESIAGTNDVMISLGGFGGFVTFGFNHSIVNIHGKKDFKIIGNAFYADANQSHSINRLGGSCEPGIVMVSFDYNQNGKPDDTWYELAGSEYRNIKTKHNYNITYLRPDVNKIATPRPLSPITDTTYIQWIDNLGSTGYIEKNAYHQQDYFPKWITDNKLTFNGTCLPNNAVDESNNASYWVLYSYDWGYVDNHPNDSTDKISFDIDWAVDANGNNVKLPCIDFVRVYTAINQTCGWIGETSTELSRAEDLHIEKSNIYTPE